MNHLENASFSSSQTAPIDATWSRGELSPPSPAQLQSHEQISDVCFKPLSLGMTYYTAKDGQNNTVHNRRFDLLSYLLFFIKKILPQVEIFPKTPHKFSGMTLFIACSADLSCPSSSPWEKVLTMGPWPSAGFPEEHPAEQKSNTDQYGSQMGILSPGKAELRCARSIQDSLDSKALVLDFKKE